MAAKQTAIQKSNAAFEKLTPSEKRVAIARDVIAQIEADKLFPQTGTYVENSDLDDEIRELYYADKTDKQIQPLVKKAEDCTVCAVGSLFVCGVKIANDFKVKDLESPEDGLQGVDAFNYLRKFFSREQLALIEVAFEVDTVHAADHGIEWNKVIEASEFGGLFDHDEYSYDEEAKAQVDSDRLRAIMENIIVNKGRFVPSKRPVRRWITPGFTG